jgi:hypothetical protein
VNQINPRETPQSPYVKPFSHPVDNEQVSALAAIAHFHGFLVKL